jgi:hypothetical protein
VELAPVQRHALAHPDEAVAVRIEGAVARAVGSIAISTSSSS